LAESAEELPERVLLIVQADSRPSESV